MSSITMLDSVSVRQTKPLSLSPVQVYPCGYQEMRSIFYQTHASLSDLHLGCPELLDSVSYSVDDGHDFRLLFQLITGWLQCASSCNTCNSKKVLRLCVHELCGMASYFGYFLLKMKIIFIYCLRYGFNCYEETP